ncbi:MAG: hypothetical protein J0L84_06235 [Verrucomicrobia bacterium]|nr:hypothetical protein [Verrucomicrobiota bacterium]
MATSSHAWRFFRAGGFDQVKLETGADLMNLDQLDQKLWVALACPVHGLEFDSKTLAIIDSDKDGRVRAPELIAAVKWAGGLLKDPDELVRAGDALNLSAINDATPEGKALLESARQILINLGKKDATAISVADTTDTARIFAQTAFNGDGIIVEESATDDATKAVIREILQCLGPVTDRSGRPGLDQGKAGQFFGELAMYESWAGQAESQAAEVLPLGPGTRAGHAALKAVKAKVDDYFGRCRLAAFDPRAAALLNRNEAEYLALAAKDLSITASEISGFPLAQVAAGKALSLKDGLNPAWAAPMAAFVAATVKPVLGEKTELTEADWAALNVKFAAYATWQASKAGGAVEGLGLPRVREILASKTQAAIAALLAQDRAEEGKVNAIAAVDKLARYHRDLHLLCINFVSFKDFYDRGEPAIFQAGRLYLDQRSCDLVLTVEDAGKHATMAALAGSYLAYLDCSRKGSGEKLSIVAAFTGGDSDNLMVGRNGLFYDRKGRDWDATITKIIENPISIRQAFWAPYKKLARFIQEQVTKRAAAADTAASDRLTKAALEAGKAAETGKGEPPPKPKLDTGLVTALAVGAAGIGGMIGSIVNGFLSLKGWMPVGVIGVLLLISGPSMLLAWLKLRNRNLGPLLDANGWAINSRARINVPFGGSLTGVAALPPGSQRDLTDPYAEKSNPWPKLVVIAIVLAIAYLLLDRKGYIDRWTNGAWGTKAPVAAQDEAPAVAPAAP